MQKHRLPHIRTVCTLALLLALGAPLAHAGFDEGHAAYQRGDYATALKELWVFYIQQGTACPKTISKQCSGTAKPQSKGLPMRKMLWPICMPMDMA